MRVQVNMNRAALNRLSKGQMIALEHTAEAVKTDVIDKQVMPFDVGTMQNESFNINTEHLYLGKVSLTVNTPYARRLYFHPEYNFNKSNNPNARGRWFDPWLDGKYKNFALGVYLTFYAKYMRL